MKPMVRFVLCFAIVLCFGLRWLLADEPISHSATHPTKPGTYVVGDWRYEYSVTNARTRSEGRSGKLFFAGKELFAPLGTVVTTPVGRFVFLPLPPGVKKIWGEDGWLQTGCYDEALFDERGSLVPRSGVTVTNLDAATLIKNNR
jgi:hypothetical protein